MYRALVKAGAVAAVAAMTLGTVATPALARGGFHHGGGSHGGGGFHGGGFHHGGDFARAGGFHHGGWDHRGGWGHRGGWDRDYAGGGYYGDYGYGYGYGYGGLGLGLAAGVIGGALLATQYPAYGYTADYPGYATDSQSAQAYCQSRFKSYNPATGTYLGYDGLRHSCP